LQHHELDFAAQVLNSLTLFPPEANPSLVLAHSIAKVFGVTIEEIFEIIEE
jgi:hypothetical protein